MSTSEERPAYAPSTTNPQCKVCTSPDRFEIEVALAQGQPQQHIARRFSSAEQGLSKQNIHSHYHRHMPVIDKAVAEAAAAQNRGVILDLETATEIEIENARNRARLRAQVSGTIENGQLNWRPRDVMAFMEFDARLGQQRSELLAGAVLDQGKAFGEAVRRVIHDDETRARIVDAYDQVLAEREMTDGRILFHGDDEDNGNNPS